MNLKNMFFLLALSFSFSLFAAPCTPVTFNQQEIVCLKKGVGNLAVHERALIIERRLNEISQDLRLDPKKISLNEMEEGFNVVIDDQFIFSLRPTDIDFESNLGFEASAQNILKRVQEAMARDRKTRAPENFIRGLIYSGIATFVLLLILFLFSKIFPKLYALERRQGEFIPSLKIQNWELVNSSRVVEFLVWLTQLGRGMLTLLALYVYIPMVLSFFPQTANLAPHILSFILNPIRHIFQMAIDFIPNIFFIVVIGVLTTYALKLIRFFFNEIERGNISFEGFHQEWAQPSFSLMRVMVIAFAVVMAFPYIPGSNSPAFQGVSVFLGVLLSLGSSSSISNIIAGVVLTYMRPFKVGDHVKISDTIGDVIEKSLLVTRIRSIKNVDVTIPNSMVLGSHMVNYSTACGETGLILTTTVTFGYDVPWPRIHELLKKAALRTAMIEQEPAPFILQNALNEFYVSYELNAHTKKPSLMVNIKSELHQHIQDVFHEEGLELIVPHYLNVRDGSGSVVPGEYRRTEG